MLQTHPFAQSISLNGLAFLFSSGYIDILACYRYRNLNET